MATEMKIEIKRITNKGLFREVAEMTTGKPCNMQWSRAIASEHSIIRAEEYLVKLHDIPQCVMGHLVRHIHAQPYVLSKRPDRGGEDFAKVCGSLSSSLLSFSESIPGKGVNESRCYLSDMANTVESLSKRFDRHAPTSMALILNAQEFINISKVRLCRKASEETREVWGAVIAKLSEVDPDLAKFCVPTCVYRGGICPEPQSCGYCRTTLFAKELNEYRKNFVK